MDNGYNPFIHADRIGVEIGFTDPVFRAHFKEKHGYDMNDAERNNPVDMEGGALGARLTGGGFGGCALALSRMDDVPKVRMSVERAFGRLDWPPPQGFRVSPAAGARRLR